MDDLEEPQEMEEDDPNYVGGTDDIDNKMMESLFDLSAYASNDDGGNDDESDSSSAGESSSSQGWTYLVGNKAPAVSISIDGVDLRLLEKARDEVPTVLDNIKRKVFGSKRYRDMSKVSPGDFLKAFMDPQLLGYLKTFINANMTSDPVSSSDIIAFIRVELMLSFYKVSPLMYFNPANVANFPSSTCGMSHARYRCILQALNSKGNTPAQLPHLVCGTTSRRHIPSATSTGIWKPPMSHNRELATAMALVRRICAEVAFIPGTTDIGLDDDLLRLRSRRVVLEGYSHTNNPNKGLGVVHHGAVSNCTSLYCGGHVASRNESTLDCVKILLLSLSGASIESQIRLNRTNFFWDRGYGGIEGDVNSFAMAKGAVLVGTSRRMKSFPFTFDQRPGTSRRLIQEKGTMAAYWAVKGTGRQTQYALAHRSGMGRVVLMHTTDEALGPGRYTLITRDGKNATIKYARDDDVVIPYLLQSSSPPGVIMLTESQRTPEWFLLRKFRITGTGAYGIWKFISSSTMNDDLLDENMNAVIQILSMRSNDNNLVEPPEEDNQSYEREALNTLLLPDLRRICRNKKLPVSGSKGILIDRILSWTSQQDEPSRRPAAEQHFVDTNEIMVHGSIQKSAKEGPDGQRRTVIESIHEFGLMCNADDTNAAFSPDAIAGIADVLPDGTSTSVVALVEMKSKCSQATLSAEMELITLYGEYQEINAEEDQ
ncbi:hypothetical protein MHU86_8889 [Fragilaria crotonensis]|nr:hypothetical protein MHU86_8889 [Fragilaria crotonensis]